MLKHWQHTEMVSDQDYQLFVKNGRPIQPKEDLPDNIAVYVTSECGSKRLEGVYDPINKAIRPLKNTTAPNRDLRLYIDTIQSEHISIIAVDGLMGTGKTSTCVEALVDMYLSKVRVPRPSELQMGWKPPEDATKVLICKPYINADGGQESYGFLPGDINQKMDPTLNNFIQYFNRFHQAGFDALRESKLLEVLPLGFIRGLDAKNMVIVMDESQNSRELISVVTRKATNSRIFLLGDTSPFQIDRVGNTPTKNGLNDIIELLRGAPYFQYIEMTSLEHIVRSPEVRDIVRRLFDKNGKSPKEWAV